MKNRKLCFTLGLAIGTSGFSLAQHKRKARARVHSWQKQQQLILDVLACPTW